MQPRIARTVPQSVRQPRPGDSKAHIQFIKQLPCVICGQLGTDPHHMLRGVDNRPKGMGRTNPDRWAVPCCRTHHDAAHDAGNDEAWFTGKGIQVRELAMALWRESGDLEAGLRVVMRARQSPT